MNLFRVLLAAMLAGLTAYTALVIAQHGLNYLPTAVADLNAMGWAGQFDLDFLMMLVLSGLWVAWRHAFSGLGLILGVIAFAGGALFLTAV